ncbi:MAG TPA: glycosyltransferase family 4 protein, partial [Casimicrobiaceae bacterium]|nr:glycosyltransferase family 4 protein [Casimicrobiaceae bacterium]
MISPQFRPLVGGYEQAAERLSAALARAGLAVVVAAERRDDAWPAQEDRDGYRVRRLRCRHRPRLHTLSSVAAYAAFLLREGRRYDVWHVHQYGAHAALAVALGALLRRPVVLKLTNSGPMGIDATLGHGFAAGAPRWLHRHVDACIATSAETRAEAVRFGLPARRVHLIPNGLDDARLQPATADERSAARRVLGLGCRRLVLAVGRLAPEKNPLGLLDAWAAVPARVREGALLALVGDGPCRDDVIARAARADVAASVRVVGQRNDVATWYRAADVFVLASIHEGLSNAMIEALACGLPVVSTRVSGSGVLTTEPQAGIVTEVADVRGLAAALGALLGNAAQRTQLGANARRVFERHFAL